MGGSDGAGQGSFDNVAKNLVTRTGLALSIDPSTRIGLLKGGVKNPPFVPQPRSQFHVGGQEFMADPPQPRWRSQAGGQESRFKGDVKNPFGVPQKSLRI